MPNVTDCGRGKKNILVLHFAESRRSLFKMIQKVLDRNMLFLLLLTLFSVQPSESIQTENEKLVRIIQDLKFSERVSV